ncbi:hypothetical protein Aau02nite_61410 [Amorphoplanes auranticolor]|uniref:Uncharacterized protein n=1 Tax=Actinoplanes auranticolor TaxID=47988 RepID=A0A919SN77_9ACTN|nr:hypothetical protein Aau02nite_61410 [Actinoplanes auranticolor]
MDWSPDAIEDLHMIADALVQGELMRLAEEELRVPATETEIEGNLKEHPGVWWRRAVRHRDLPDFLSFGSDPAVSPLDRSRDFVFVYRHLTTTERIKLRRRHKTFVVLRVLSNDELARRLAGPS